MKTARRSQANVRGESMIWFSGWMFCCACSMLIVLVLYIGYQGLINHWPSRVALFEVERNLVGGEWLSTTKKDSGFSTEYHVRTGDRGIGVTSFEVITHQPFKPVSIHFPAEIWTVERKDDDVLFGFPIRMTQYRNPHLLSVASLANVLVMGWEQWAIRNPDQTKGLEGFAGELRDRYNRLEKESRETSIVQGMRFEDTLKEWRQIIQQVDKQIAQSQSALGSLDMSLAQSRREVRRVSRLEQLDSDRLIDEAIEQSFAQSAIEHQRQELMMSKSLWLDLVKEDERLTMQIELAAKSLDSALATTSQSNSLFKTEEFEKRVLALPETTRKTLAKTINQAKEISAKQLKLNTQLAELERTRQGFRIAFAVPVLSSDQEKTENTLHSHLIRREGKDGSVDYHWVFRANDKESYVVPLETRELLVGDIVRCYTPNRLSLFGKTRIYLSRWKEFLFGFPRQAGMAGGLFPAIWGTVVMTLLMSLLVMPFGVMAAIYIREYAKNTWLISLIRITINNLAGVPSIVYGVFGLAFFCYLIGGYVDGGPEKIGVSTWSYSKWSGVCLLTLLSSLLAVALILRGSSMNPNRYPKLSSLLVFGLCLCCLVGFGLLIAKCPFFDGLYREDLPNPTFGKGCLLWASLTLALLTLPVVIVSTEEALAAVPQSLREGSYACGASQWQTIYRLVIPHARPGIITGLILAMARGAGEVAPLMLVGAIPLTSDLPVDGSPPFVHGSRAFMHLGFQIYSFGFQSQNSEAARPIVFSATLLLLVIVWTLNAAAIWLRSRLRSRTQSSQF